MSRQNSNAGERITAVVINYNSGPALAAAIEALRNQTVTFEEIIVVDNDSTDGSTDIDNRDEAFRLIQSGENAGAAAARNAGFEAATTELVMVIDADMLPAPDCAENLLRTLDEFEATVALPRIVYAPEFTTVQFDGGDPHFLGLLSLHNRDTPLADSPAVDRIVNAAPSSCLLVNRERVLALGGFCSFYFFYFEDLEFGQRLTMAGERIVFTSSAVTGHDQGEGTPGLSYRGTGDYPKRRAYLTMRNRLLTIACLYSGRSIVLLLPALVVFEGVTFLGSIWRGWTAQWLSAWWWLFRNHRVWRRHRVMAQSHRQCRDSAVLTGGDIPFATGFLNAGWQERLAAVLSAMLNGWWRAVRRWL